MMPHNNPYDNIAPLEVHEVVRQLREMISEEYAAANLYERLAAAIDDPLVGDAILDIAEEEITHAGEFEYMVEYVQEKYGTHAETDDEVMDAGEEEAEELFGNDEHNEMPVEQDVLQPTDDRVVDEGY